MCASLSCTVVLLCECHDVAMSEAVMAVVGEYVDDTPGGVMKTVASGRSVAPCPVAVRGEGCKFVGAMTDYHHPDVSEAHKEDVAAVVGWE